MFIQQMVSEEALNEFIKRVRERVEQRGGRLINITQEPMQMNFTFANAQGREETWALYIDMETQGLDYIRVLGG